MPRGGRGKSREPGRKRGRKRESHFMDVAIDGYIRDVALHLWRDVEELTEVHGGDVGRALEEVGSLPLAGPYRPLWQAAWRAHVWPGPPDASEHLFGRMERAVREALLQEREARPAQGDVTIEDTPGYKEFVGRAMDQLLEEASGENEQWDET
jgi:hypothetical protein